MKGRVHPDDEPVDLRNPKGTRSVIDKDAEPREPATEGPSSWRYWRDRAGHFQGEASKLSDKCVMQDIRLRAAENRIAQLERVVEAARLLSLSLPDVALEQAESAWGVTNTVIARRRRDALAAALEGSTDATD